MRKNAPNDIQKNGGFNVVITNDTVNEQELNKKFKWFKSTKYNIETTDYFYEYNEDEPSELVQSLFGIIPTPGEPLTVIKINSEHINFFSPNLFEASQALMNLDPYDDEKILKFYKEYGPLGIMPYYTSKGYYGNIIKDIHRQVSIKYNDNECDEYWGDMFGLKNKFPGDLSDVDANRYFVHEFNSFTGQNMYSSYQEPLWMVRYVVLDYQSTCRLLSCNGNISKAKKVYENFVDIFWGSQKENEYFSMFKDFQEQIRQEIKIIPGFKISEIKSLKLFALCNSLIHALYLYTILNIQHMPLEKCKAPDCFNLFWKINSRRQYCSDRCKTRIGVRKCRKQKNINKQEAD